MWSVELQIVPRLVLAAATSASITGYQHPTQHGMLTGPVSMSAHLQLRFDKRSA